MRPYLPNDFALISAVNDVDILNACLLRSPDIVAGELPVFTIEGATSMAEAYNRGLTMTDRPICIFAHQDVYLPQGWLALVSEKLSDLEKIDQSWEVVGPYGVQADGRHAGRIWDVTLNSELGSPQFSPTPVVSLDELVLIVRTGPGYSFDAALPHFHLYGTDIVQSALAAGRSAYAIEIPVVHNNRPILSLNGGYALAYHYARRKWARRLPIPTTICMLSRNPLHLWRASRGFRHSKQRPDGLLADAPTVAVIAGYEKRPPEVVVEPLGPNGS